MDSVKLSILCKCFLILKKKKKSKQNPFKVYTEIQWSTDNGANLQLVENVRASTTPMEQWKSTSVGDAPLNT